MAYGAGMVANFLGGILSDRLSPRPVFMGSLLMATVAAVGWVLIPGTGWPFWVVTAAWGFAVNGAGAVILIYGQDIFPGRAGICLGPSRKLQYSYRGHNRLPWRRRHGGSVSGDTAPGGGARGVGKRRRLRGLGAVPGGRSELGPRATNLC